MVNDPAILSKPWLESSAGRNFVASTCKPRMSRIAFVYSERLSRCSPGAGRCVSAWRSSSFSSQAASPLSVPASGRFALVGGIKPARTLRTTFSQISGCSPTLLRSKSSNANRTAESSLADLARRL